MPVCIGVLKETSALEARVALATANVRQYRAIAGLSVVSFRPR